MKPNAALTADGKKHDHNLSLQVEETLKCQINTTIQKQFLKVCMCAVCTVVCPGTPLTGTQTWSASLMWML